MRIRERSLKGFITNEVDERPSSTLDLHDSIIHAHLVRLHRNRIFPSHTQYCESADPAAQPAVVSLGSFNGQACVPSLH